MYSASARFYEICKNKTHCHNNKEKHSYLVKVWAWLGFADPIEVGNIDELEIIVKTCIGQFILSRVNDVGQISQFLVAPVVQVADATRRNYRE
jgi:hypothetical protein